MATPTTWPNDFLGQRLFIANLEDLLAGAESSVGTFTYIGSTEPTTDDLIAAVQTQIPGTSLPFDAEIQWYDPVDDDIKEVYIIPKTPGGVDLVGTLYRMQPEPEEVTVSAIHKERIAAAVASVTTSPNFDTGYTDLVAVGMVRSSLAGTTFDASILRVNAVSAASYDTQFLDGSGVNDANGATSWDGNVTPAGAASYFWTALWSWFSRYNVSKEVDAQSWSNAYSGSGSNARWAHRYYRTDTAINNFFFDPGTGNIQAGSRLTFYGFK